MTSNTPCLLAAPHTYALTGTWIAGDGEPGFALVESYPVLAYNARGQALIFSLDQQRLEPVDEYLAYRAGERLLEVLCTDQLPLRLDHHADAMEMVERARRRHAAGG